METTGPSIITLRAYVRGAYQIQKLRIQMGNRVVAAIKVRLGQLPSESEDEMDSEGKAIIKALRANWKRITDGVVRLPKEAQLDFPHRETSIIAPYTELALIASYLECEAHEQEHFKRLGRMLDEYPIWTEWLKEVKGVGPAMAGVIISELDIHKARYASSLWKYAGLDVAPDGRGRSRQDAHLVDVEYTASDGSTKSRRSVTFNPFLKTKLTGVLVPSFIKIGPLEGVKKDGTPKVGSPFATIYYDYKHRLESHAKYGIEHDGVKNDKGKVEVSKGRRHNMAVRYAAKQFLLQLYLRWRELEGLPVAPSYQEAKLGHKHNAA